MNFTFDIVSWSVIPIVFIGVAILILIAWVMTLIEIVNHEYVGLNKIVWLGLVIALPFIGMIIYYCIGRKDRLGKTVRSGNHNYSKDEFV